MHTMLLLLLAAGPCAGFVLPTGLRQPRSHGTPVPPALQRSTTTALSAIDFSDPVATAGFFLWGSPVPLALAALFNTREKGDGSPTREMEVPQVPQAASRRGRPSLSLPKGLSLTEASEEALGKGPLGTQSGMMFAFPSFGLAMDDAAKCPPVGYPRAARAFFALNVYAGIYYYLYYKWKAEDELLAYTGKGLGGALIVVPFALGFTLGIGGEALYGSLEPGAPLDAFSATFYASFLWIYVNQFLLYERVNDLYRDDGLPAPIASWTLLLPPVNFASGIRQIHFLSAYWAAKRGEPLQRDAFCEAFPFATKPELGVVELVTTPSLWYDGFGQGSD